MSLPYCFLLHPRESLRVKCFLISFVIFSKFIVVRNVIEVSFECCLLSDGLLSQSPNSGGMSVSSFSDVEVRGEGDDGRKK